MALDDDVIFPYSSKSADGTADSSYARMSLISNSRDYCSPMILEYGSSVSYIGVPSILMDFLASGIVMTFFSRSYGSYLAILFQIHPSAAVPVQGLYLHSHF